MSRAEPSCDNTKLLSPTVSKVIARPSPSRVYTALLGARGFADVFRFADFRIPRRVCYV